MNRNFAHLRFENKALYFNDITDIPLLRKPYSSSPRSSNFAKIWIFPERSQRSINETLPLPLFESKRPATHTSLFSYSSKLFLIVSVRTSRALVVITNGSLPAFEGVKLFVSDLDNIACAGLLWLLTHFQSFLSFQHQ